MRFSLLSNRGSLLKRLALATCAILAAVLALHLTSSPAIQVTPGAALGNAPPDQAIQPGYADASSRINAYLTRLTRLGDFSGSVLVARSGNVVLRKGYGMADRVARIPNTPQTIFHLASVSKQFAATAIMLLQADGKLNVQDRICLYVPACPRTWRSITIHQLLTHTSGIPDYMAFTDIDSLFRRSLTPGQLVAQFKWRRLDFAPGTKWRYNNSGYALLGYIVERVSGMDYQSFLDQRIFDPLGMTDSGYDHGQAIQQPRAIGYADDGGVDPIKMSVAYAAGGLYATVDDLYRWDQALYTSQLLPRDLLDMMFTPYAHTRTSSQDYGYGWVLGNREGKHTTEHAGSLGDFTSLIIRIPEDHTTIIVLCNQNADLSKVGDTLVKLLYS